MNKAEALQRVREVCRVRRLSRHTEDTYAGWIARFIDHVRQCPELPREERLRVFLAGWGTPTARDHFPAHTAEYIAEKKALGHGMANLNDQVSGVISTSSPAATEKRGALNPAHSRWLMGYPAAWDFCGATAMQSSRRSRQSSSKPSPKPSLPTTKTHERPD